MPPSQSASRVTLEVSLCDILASWPWGVVVRLPHATITGDRLLALVKVVLTYKQNDQRYNKTFWGWPCETTVVLRAVFIHGISLCHIQERLIYMRYLLVKFINTGPVWYFGFDTSADTTENAGISIGKYSSPAQFQYHVKYYSLNGTQLLPS